MPLKRINADCMISIILPNLNTSINYLRPRIQSILDQTYPTWECIVIDAFSDNGSWEFIQSITRHDGRFRLYQKDRKGIYNAWNEGIKLARGGYIYIATSDDTMEPTFLAEMHAALDSNKQCDLAHCCLKIINDDGLPSEIHRWDNYPSAVFFGEMIKQPHIRLAPHDGLLHAFIKTVYHSITQLLIRKSVFDEFGLFKEDGGVIADYEWGLRISLFKNIVHVPKYLATWRVHAEQATTLDIQTDPSTYDKLIDWVKGNVAAYKNKLGNDHEIDLDELIRVYESYRTYYRAQHFRKSHPLIFKIGNRLIPKSRPKMLNGLTVAQNYFAEHNLGRLILSHS